MQTTRRKLLPAHWALVLIAIGGLAFTACWGRDLYGKLTVPAGAVVKFNGMTGLVVMEIDAEKSDLGPESRWPSNRLPGIQSRCGAGR